MEKSSRNVLTTQLEHASFNFMGGLLRWGAVERQRRAKERESREAERIAACRALYRGAQKLIVTSEFTKPVHIPSDTETPHRLRLVLAFSGNRIVVIDQGLNEGFPIMITDITRLGNSRRQRFDDRHKTTNLTADTATTSTRYFTIQQETAHLRHSIGATPQPEEKPLPTADALYWEKTLPFLPAIPAVFAELAMQAWLPSESKQVTA